MQLALRTVTSEPLPRRRRTRPGARGRAPSSIAPVAFPSDPLQFGIGAEQIFDHARDALVVVELKSGRIARCNMAAQELFGCAAEDVVGRRIDTILQPEAARLHFTRVEQYRRSGDPELFLGRPPVNLRVRTSRGCEIPAELSAAPLSLRGHPAEWLVLTFRGAQCRHDLDEAKAALARAEKTQQQMQANVDRSNAFFRRTVIELAVPLERVRRTSRHIARLAASGDDGDRARLAVLARVLEARTDELERHIGLLADISAIENGNLELNPQRVNLVPLVSGIVARASARATGHRLKFSAPQGLTAVCDADRICAIIEELIRRAIARNPRGCWIDIDLRRPLAGVARIEVRDYGRGLSNTERQLWLGDGSEDRAWFVARSVIEGHRGTLKIELPREGGVRATVTLPTRAQSWAPSRATP